MPSHADDRLLWIFVGIGLATGIWVVHHELHRVRDLTKVTHDETSDQVLGQEAEDALKLETLEKLATSHDYELRSAALKIISDRSTKGPAFKLLLRDLASDKPKVRDRALAAVWFLLSNKSLARSPAAYRLKEPNFATALTTCLINIKNEHPPIELAQPDLDSRHTSPVRPLFRPPSELRALRILDASLRSEIYSFLDTDLIPLWLARYPFPCVLPIWNGRAGKTDIVELFKTWWNDDPVMGEIVAQLSCHPQGRKQLRRHGLMPSILYDDDPTRRKTHRHTETLWPDDPNREIAADDISSDDSDVWMTGGEDTAGIVPIQPSSNPTTTTTARSARARRPRDESAEEQALRRRRREAMVLSEGGRPLGQDNIIQRPVRADTGDLQMQPLASGAITVGDSLTPEAAAEIVDSAVEEALLGGSLERSEEEQVEEELEELEAQVAEAAGVAGEGGEEDNLAEAEPQEDPFAGTAGSSGWMSWPFGRR